MLADRQDVIHLDTISPRAPLFAKFDAAVCRLLCLFMVGVSV